MTTDELLKTKLYIAPERSETIARPRLFEHLDRGQMGKLTLVSAPAGFGKTTLLSEWARQSEYLVAWLSLDKSDNDLVLFLAYVIAALQTIIPGVGDASLFMLKSSHPPLLEAILTALINELAVESDPFSLVLDDYHLIESESVHDAVRFLLDHHPLQMNLIIATRADPPLPVARLRGRSELVEVRMAELRFTLNEAMVFLNQMKDLTLSAEDIAVLHTQTEGWITGLQLAVLSLHGQKNSRDFIKTFTGSNRYILDFLVDEVLQQQSAELQTFLYQTAILDRLTAPLCNTITGRDDSQTILANIERVNLFIVPLDEDRQWYRYHHLFADLLQRRLQQTQPDMISVLHARACKWYEENNFMSLAIHHALSGQDFAQAAYLVESCAEMVLVRGEATTFLNWLEGLPSDVISRHPLLYVYQAGVLLTSGQSMETIEVRLQSAEETDSEGAFVGEIMAIRALQAVYQGNLRQATDLLGQALSLLAEDSLFLRGMVFGGLGIVQLLADDRIAAEQTYEQMVALGEKFGALSIGVAALCWLGRLQQTRGYLRSAFLLFNQALEKAKDEHGQLLPIAGPALVGLGELQREWNNMETAIRYLSDGIALSEGTGEVILMMSARLTMARIWQIQGHVDRANETIREARQLALRTDTTEYDNLTVSFYQARIWLRQHNLEAVKQWITERGLHTRDALDKLDLSDEYTSLHTQAIEFVVLARLFLAQGESDRALQVLDALLLKLEPNEYLALWIEIYILKALALQSIATLPKALEVLEQALSLAQPEGYVRMFVDEGRPLAHLLYEARSRDILPQYTGMLLAAFPAETEKQIHGTQPDLVEPLSQRELEVLQLLTQGLSNHEIAAQLVISLSTVKGHVSNILGKLEASNRTQAVAKARILGVLPDE